MYSDIRESMTETDVECILQRAHDMRPHDKSAPVVVPSSARRLHDAHAWRCYRISSRAHRSAWRDSTSMRS